MDFLIGGLAGAGATVLTNPIDVVKTRLQLQGELRAQERSVPKLYRNLFHGALVIGKTEGLVALQKGLVPATLFGFVMNGIRLGIYKFADREEWTRNEANRVTFPRSAGWGGLSGSISGVFSNPMNVVKTRLQASSHPSIAVGKQHGYTGSIDAIASIYAHEGVRGFFSGVYAGCWRYGVGSAAQLSFFSMSKQMFLSHDLLTNSPLLLTFFASAVSGAALSAFSCPLEVIIVRLYNQGKKKDGSRTYKGLVDCIRQILRTEGPTAFYKGVTPFYVRIAPHTTFMLMFWDGLNEMAGR